jgi:alcohol dehydrogenase (cytochrome c)/quinohemoprotein ethanol dehydrogenase
VALKSGHPQPLCRLLVFKVGGTAKLPPAPKPYRPPLDAPPLTATPAELAQGGALYGHYCGLCHGGGAVSGSTLPDLRYTPLLASDGFFDVVLGGQRKDQGMISFAPVLTHDQAASIRSYLIQRAHEAKAEQAKGQDLSAG